jgi:hypothetical protein
MGVNAYAALVAPRTLRRPYMAPSCSFLYTLSPACRPICRQPAACNTATTAAALLLSSMFCTILPHASCMRNRHVRVGNCCSMHHLLIDGISLHTQYLKVICAASACCYRPQMQHGALSVPPVHAATDPTCSAGSAGAAHSHAALPATPPACLHLGEAGNMYAQPCLLQTLHDISACMCISCHAASPTYGSCIAAFAACEWWTTSE